MSYVGGSPSDVVIEYLVGKGIVSRPRQLKTWPCFGGKLPDDIQEDNALEISDTLGHITGTSVRDGTIYEHVGFQVMGRSKDYNEIYAKLIDIAVAFTKVSREKVIFNSRAYILNSITRLGNIIYVEQEVKNRRDILVFNGILSITDTGSPT